MKPAAALYFLLLISLHVVGATQPVLEVPLSVFRDGKYAWLGYAIFAVLLLIGAMYATTLVRAERPGAALMAACAVLLLFVVAATPSLGSFHLLCSLLLFALLFGYYAVLLYRAESFWLIAHLAVPLLLAFATRFHSYGIWQKGFVSYFVIAATIHHYLVVRQLRAVQARGPKKRPTYTAGTRKKRKVYRLHPGPVWERKDPAAGRQ